MLARTLRAQRVFQTRSLLIPRTQHRKFATPTTTTPPTHSPQSQSWLTRKVLASPSAKKFFISLTNILGYGSPKQVAGRRSYVVYEQLCALRADQTKQFWQEECYLPPTFQSWFTITNLHVWLLTARFRALPEPHGKALIQGLIDHFFIDVDDRIRAVLQPQARRPEPYTIKSNFYSTPSIPSDNKKIGKPFGNAPDRLVTQQMKIFKEQWAGMGMSLDLGLVTNDMELAAAIWRNLLGARGAQGIATSSTFRRSVNLVGGEVVNVAKINLETEEARDDGSGVHDFPPEESDKYLNYPGLMADLVAYLRRELVRLEALSDEEIISGDPQKLAFGSIRPTSRPLEKKMP